MEEVTKDSILQALKEAGIENLDQFAESLARSGKESPFGDTTGFQNPGDLVSGGKLIAIYKWDRTSDDSEILNSLEDVRSVNSLNQQLGE